jgi:diguanylate cyclase (GGDEF)-like protein/PAS domain S-box-containing protein
MTETHIGRTTPVTPKPLADLTRLPQQPALVCDGAGLVVEVNDPLVTMCGLTGPDSLLGRPIGDLMVVTDEGTWLRVSAGLSLPVRAARWSDPGCTRTHVTFSDVSDLVAATDALYEEQRRLNDVQRVARMASFEYDIASRATLWSPNGYQMLGLIPGTMSSGIDALLRQLHPNDVDSAVRHWQHHLATGDPMSKVLRSAPDASSAGRVRYVLCEASVQRDANGTPIKSTGFVRDITELWSMGVELERERLKLVDAQRIAGIGNWTVDLRDGSVARSGDVAFMLSPGPPTLENLYDGIHPDDRAEATRIVGQLASGELEGTVHYEMRDVTGDKFYLASGSAERDKTGAVIKINGTVQDVTHIHILERQVVADRTRLREASRLAGLAVWEWDTVTDEITWSDNLAALYGIDEDKQDHWENFVAVTHPDDIDLITGLADRLRESGGPVEIEFHIIRPSDGMVRVMRGYTRFRPDVADDRIVIGTVQDVTDQRSAEIRVLRSSQRFTDLVAANPVGIALFDEEERLVDANDALCDLLGGTVEQLRGRAVSELRHADDPSTPVGLSGLAELGKSNQVAPQRMIHRVNGEIAYCEVHVAVSVQDDGRRFWLVMFADVTERRLAEAASKHRQTTDELTGLLNRVGVKQHLQHLLRPGKGPKRSASHRAAVKNLAVMFCDIDNFKRVNDSLGHDRGDELLQSLAKRLERGLPEGCTAARWSGDEFVVLCEDTAALGGIDAVAKEISELLRSAISVGGQVIRVSASIGAAVPSTGMESEVDLLRFADAAMFEAKRRGAGKIAVANAALIASADRQLHLESQLRDALAADGLTLHFQPIVDPAGEVQSAEALVRWHHPERGLLAPDAFLSIAAEGDLMRELDKWVLRTALREAVNWPQRDGRAPSVAINLSALLPGSPGFTQVVSKAIAEADIDPSRVILELVETSLIALPSESRTAMSELVAIGVRFAVDDFGTGYSSLARLKELPAQIIKVDRRFVSGVGKDASDTAVARAVVEMARAMGRSCVAEGVERATQFHALRQVGVDAFQGWLFSRPKPAKEFGVLLAKGPLGVPRGKTR